MRKHGFLLLFFSCLLGTSYGQLAPGHSTIYNPVRYIKIAADTFRMPVGDTLGPKTMGRQVFKSSDSTVYVANGLRWDAIGKGAVVPVELLFFEDHLSDIGGALKVHSVRKVINVADYGVVADGTDQTVKLQAAINDMDAGYTLFIPQGIFRFTKLKFNPPDGSKLICEGQLQTTATSGVIFQVGDSTNPSDRYTIEGLTITPTAINWSNNLVGVQFINQYGGNFRLNTILGFRKNIELIGWNGNGVSYNNFFIGRSSAGKHALYLTAGNNGWCNENKFFGGAFTYTTENTVDSTCSLIFIDHYAAHPLNNNIFYGPSLEGNGTALGYAARVKGIYNQILNARRESIGDIILDTTSTQNTINVSYDDYTYPVTDYGNRNNISTVTQMNLSSDVDKMLKLRNVGSSANKAISIEDVFGNETFYIDAAGRVASAHSIYSEDGFRWSSSNGSRNDRGIFVGVGSPEGVVTARGGSIYLSRSGGVRTTLYTKEVDGGNTGWVVPDAYSIRYSDDQSLSVAQRARALRNVGSYETNEDSAVNLNEETRPHISQYFSANLYLNQPPVSDYYTVTTVRSEVYPTEQGYQIAMGTVHKSNYYRVLDTAGWSPWSRVVSLSILQDSLTARAARFTAIDPLHYSNDTLTIDYAGDGQDGVISNADYYAMARKPIVGGAAATGGIANLVAGTVTVNTTAVGVGSMIMLSYQTCNNCATVYKGTITAATSFVINSTDATDTSAVAWWIID